MAYLNLDLDFHEHPKVKRLVGLLGRGAEGLLTRLWCYCGKHFCVTGILTGHSGQEIESIIQWWGKPGVCVEAMLKLDFLSGEEGNYSVHDFLEHSGHLRALKERGRANARKRWDKVASDAASNATSIPDSNAPQDGKDGNKDSSNGAREFFNSGIHHEVSARAKAIVAYYFARVAPSRLKTAAVAERLLAQIFLDEPKLADAAIIHGIDCYAKECAEEKPSMRSSPAKFIEDRAWESYDGRVKISPSEKSARERAAEAEKRLPK